MDVAVTLVLTRIGLWITGFFLAPLFIDRPSSLRDVGPPLIAIWTRWDGGLYSTLAQVGYFVRDKSPDTAFFPLYPWIVQLLTGWTSRLDLIAIAELIVANVMLVVLLIYVVALGRLDFDDGVGRRAAVYYLVVPMTLFLSAAYAESLFLALTVASFYHARRGQLALAGVLGFFAALTRPYGFLLVIPIAWEALRRRKLPIAAIGPVMGPIVFFGWLWLQLGDPLLWFKAQTAWGRHLDFPWRGFLNYRHWLGGWFEPPGLGLVDFIVAAALVVLTGVALWKLPRIYGVFTAVTVLAFLSATHFQSMTRWALMAFPIFFLVAMWSRNRWLNYAIIASSYVLALYFMARFSQWKWVA